MITTTIDDYLWYVDSCLDAMVEILEGLGDDLANTRPGLRGGNSPYAIVTHCLGVLNHWGGDEISGRPVVRDRDAEFVESSVDEAALVALLDEADAFLDRVAMTAPDLGRTVALPTLSADERRPAMTWLIFNYAHAREHFGQLLLTKQLALHPGTD